MSDPTRKEYEGAMEDAEWGYPPQKPAFVTIRAYVAILEATITDLLDVVEAGVVADSEWWNYRPGYEPFCVAMDDLKAALAKPSIQAALKERRGQ